MGGGFATCNIMPMKRHENVVVFYKHKPTYNPQFQEYKDSTKIRFKQGELVNRRKQLITSTNQINGGLSLAVSPIDFTRGRYPESVQYFASERTAMSNRLHPTQKPVPLFEYLTKTYSNEGNLVCDPFMGSGTTAIACIKTGRNYIGSEISAEYCKIAEDRIAKAKEQQVMELSI